MKQIYDLQQTIREDEQLVAQLQKQLHFAQGILNAHRNALTRLLPLPKETPYQTEKVAESVALLQEGVGREPVKQCITLENWKTLGIDVGDKVEIVVSGSVSFGSGVLYVSGVEEKSYDSGAFLCLTKDNCYAHWYYYNDNKLYEDELYLIRTPEGSLNKVVNC